MSEKYMPNVGDKVRATLGENVLVGTVDPGPQPYMRIAVRPDDYVVTIIPDHWQFEQIVSVPSKPWALVGHPTDYDYVPYIRDRAGNWHEIQSEGNTFPTDEATVARYLTRGFTVLFDGVDE